MISYLHGKLVEKSPTEITVDVNGIAYAVHIPLSTFEALGEVGTDVKILTYLHFREDAMQLYGFSTPAERDLFKLLISISGIGPKMAQGILSGASVNELRNYIFHGNFAGLMSIQGVGKKTAERLVVELRDKVGKLEYEVPLEEDKAAAMRNEALLALTSLGYARATAEKAIRTVLQESDGSELAVEELIKRALRRTNL
ncbi:MAG: Holliday junction branch migration protein RuvA [Bacteroidota bacterium]